MFQLVKAAVAGLVLVEAGAAAGGEGVSAWDVATGVDGNFPTLNKHIHTAALSQGGKRTHHAKAHHHKQSAVHRTVHRRQHRRASKHANTAKHQAKHKKGHRTHSSSKHAKHLRAKKGHRHTAHKHLVKHGRHHTVGTTTTAPVQEDVDEADAPMEVVTSTSQEAVATSSMAKLAPIVAVAPAVHMAVQTKHQLVSKSQTHDDDEDDTENKKDDEDTKKDDEDTKKVRYGPNDCVSTWRDSQGRCMMQTDCKEEDLQRYDFSVVCIDQGGAEVRHIFGEDSFDTRETFNTLLTCKECQGWPRSAPATPAPATSTAAPVQLHAKEDSVVKKAEDAAGKVELSTAQAVEQLVGQVKELKEQLKVAAKDVDVLNQKVGITSTKEEAAPQAAAPTTTVALTVILQSQRKAAKLDKAAEAPTRKQRSLRAKPITHLKQQAEDDEEGVLEESEENAQAAVSSDASTNDAGASDEKMETSQTDAGDDASEGQEVD